jgi:hypothetical protein
VSPPMVITLSVMADPFINHLWRTLPPSSQNGGPDSTRERSGEELVEAGLHAGADPLLERAVLG